MRENIKCKNVGISIQKVARMKKSLDSTRLRKPKHPLGREDGKGKLVRMRKEQRGKPSERA